MAVSANTALVVAAPNTQPMEKPKTQKPRKPSRQSYNHIHRNLLPVEVHPLPVLVPHNPVSLVAIALSYLTRVIAPPRRTIYSGYFSSTTSSVHVTDHATIRALWEMGFFGRGSLSRSEPTWQDTQKRKGITAEENTSQRRNERRQAKLERAKKEQEDIAQQLSKEQQTKYSHVSSPDNASKEVTSEPINGNILKTNETDMKGIDSVLHTTTSEDTKKSDKIDKTNTTILANGIPTPPPTIASEGEPERPPAKRQRSKTVRFSPTTEAREFDLSSPVIAPIKSPGSAAILEEEVPPSPTTPTPPPPAPDMENKEHLNLSLEEAFFLSYGLGVLDIHCEDSDAVLSPASLLSLFCRHSYQPTRSLATPRQPDDPFMLSYAVYHHYRSLGWVVRSGVKFAVDFLLYNRGPAFAHAEFAIVVLPAYSHPYWSETPELRKHVMTKTRKSWDWLHGVNRVQAQVHKSLVLCYVEVPPPVISEKGCDIDIGKELSDYVIRDISVKRWTPNRTRD